MTVSRRSVWLAVAALTLVVFAVAWFLANFEQVPVDRYEGAQREAQRNEWLAVERTFAGLGRPLIRVGSPAALETHRVGGVLLLDMHRRRSVSPDRAELILNWVADGGYLIVAAEPFDSDPVLDGLGVHRCERKPRKAKVQPRSDLDPCRPPAGAGRTVTIRLPGDDAAPYRLRRSAAMLQLGRGQPEWRPDNSGAWVHLRHGRGHVTVVDSLDFMHNRALGKLDHADLLWALVSRYGPQGEIRLATRLSMPSIWEWLAESASTVLASGAVLLLLWLWRIVPRFGSPVAAVASERRELRQHLAAVGRCVWREGGLGHWLTVARGDVRARLALRHPQLDRLDASEQRRLLARLSGASAAEVWNAVTPKRGTTPPEFTAAMQILQRLDRQQTLSPAPAAAGGHGEGQSHPKETNP